MNVIPTIIEKSYDREYAFDLYSKLLESRIIFCVGDINDQNANIIVSELLYLDSISHDDIYLYINSPGGSVTSGLAIYDTINYINSDVKTIAIGMAASMGAFLLSSGTKGKRCALKNAEIMIHQPLGGASGKATDIKIVAEQIIKIKDKLNNILAANTGKQKSRIEKDVEKDYYMTSEEAKKYGLIDIIL